MEQAVVLPANLRRLASLAFIGLAVSLCGSDGSLSYIPANCNGGELTLFPPVGQALVVSLPPDLKCVGFSPDGKSVFAVGIATPKGDQRSLSRIEFNPIRVSAADAAVS